MYYWNNFIEDVRDNLKIGNVLLDAGAGDCHWKNHFSSKVKYISMDLGVGDARCDYSQLDINGDLRDIPLENSSVDVIISIQVFEHLPEPWKVLAEFNRILKVDGCVFITCPQGEPQHQVPYDFFRYTPFGLRSLLESNGFEVVWIKPQLGNFHKVGNDLTYSARNLTKVSRNPVKNFLLTILSVYLRLMWRIHKPFLEKLDQFETLQDNPVGHFVMARKTRLIGS